MKPASWALLPWAALLFVSAMPAYASRHTATECREGGDFVRNAAISRDNGLPREAFISHLIADLSMIRGLPESLRWFARDEADESLLVRHAERVYDEGLSPQDNEAAFLAECGGASERSQLNSTR